MYPKYEPEKWNNNIYIRKSHNCYAYALDTINIKLINLCKTKDKNSNSYFKCSRPQPNNPLGYSDISSCKTIEERMLIDNPKIKKVNKKLNLNEIPKGYYLIALACTKNNDNYHFYRRDSSGLWSHKNGWRKATNKDNKRRLIIDPKYSDRGDFKIFCGYYIVPINDTKFYNINEISNLAN